MRPIGAELCNVLITEAPATTDELHALREHFLSLHQALTVSGPRFSNPARDAVDMHNRAVRRLKGIKDEARRRAALEVDPELLEIQ